jgi:Arc/MetJ-type ribon-helix-helix transcriptional regulator
MARAKIAITVDEQAVAEIDRLVREGMFANRSQAIEAAVKERIERIRQTRLARESAKLSSAEEQALAEKGTPEKVSGPNTEGRRLLGRAQPDDWKRASWPRPVVVLSHEVFNEHSGTVIAVAVTSQPPRAGFPLTLEITSAKLPKRSWVKISQIRKLSVRRLGKTDSPCLS